MHEHDQELIMALAEGNLAGDEAAAAEAEIAGCAECSTDLELQIAAIAMLDDVPEVYLTAAESARLHTDLKRELSLTTSRATAPRRSFSWSRILPAAGVAAALLVVIVSLPSLLGGSDSDDSSDENMALPSFEADATETTAAMEVPREALEEMDGSDGAAAEAAPPAATGAPATTTTMAALTDDASGDLLGALDFLGPVDEVDTGALLDSVLGDDADLAGGSEQAKEFDPLLASCLAESVTPEVAPSWDLPVDSSPVILGIVIDDLGAELVLVAYVPDDVANTVLATVTPGCADIRLLP